MNPALRTSLYLLLIVCVGVLVYLPAFRASFHLDDGPSIRDNAVLRRFDPAAVFNYWPTRFLTYLSLALTFRSAALDPFPYHLGNVIIHLINSLTVYFLLRRVLGRADPLPSLIGALVFLLHPLQTQAVTYVIQRATSLAAGFYLLSFLFYLKCFQIEEKRSVNNEAVSERNHPFRIVFYLLSFLFAIGAMLTKEFTVTLPVTLVLVECIFCRGIPAQGFKRFERFKRFKRVKQFKRFIRLLPFLLALLIIPLTVRMHSANPHYNDSGQVEWLRETGVMAETAPGHGESPRLYLLTQTRVFITYLRLIVLPLNQQVDYDYPKIFSFFEPGVTVYIATIISLIIIALFCCRRKNLNAVGFGIFWFIIVLLPESSIIPIIDVVVEHRLYLPLFGAVLVFAVLIRSLVRYRRTRFFLSAAAVILLGWLTYQRNLVWEDPVTLWEDNVRKAPGRDRVHGNLGKAYLDRGRYEKAAEEFRKLIEIDPTFAGAYNNLAVIYIDHIKDYAVAEKYIEASLTLFPDYPAGYVNRGVIHLNNRRLRAAIRDFEKAVELDPENLLAYYNLGACYINLGDLYARDASSLRSLNKEESAREKDAAAAAEFARAEWFLRQGLSYWPEEARFYVLLARLYRGTGEAVKAEAYFGKARSLQR